MDDTFAFRFIFFFTASASVATRKERPLISRSESLTVAYDSLSPQELTRAVYNLVASDGGNSKAVHMMGVDLDPVLVQRAAEQQLINPEDAIEFQSLDVMTARGQAQLICRQYLERTTRRQKFDFVFCFSTTMWVHLNHGDEGLKDLLKFLAEWAENVIVEPQPWKCYRNAVRRMKRANVDPFPLYESLRYRSNILQDVEDIFCHQLGMSLHRRLGHSEWKRPVLWFRRPSPQ